MNKNTITARVRSAIRRQKGTALEIACDLNISTQQAESAIEKLRGHGLVIVAGQHFTGAKGRPHNVYAARA